MSSKVANLGERPIQQQGVVVSMHHVNKNPGIIVPLYSVNKGLIKQTEKVVVAPKPVRRLDPESAFGGVY